MNKFLKSYDINRGGGGKMLFATLSPRCPKVSLSVSLEVWFFLHKLYSEGTGFFLSNLSKIS